MTSTPAQTSGSDFGRASLGIELGSTRIKACLIDESFQTLATGSHEWENDYVDGRWTYSVDAVWAGLAAAYAELADDVRSRYGTPLTTVGAIGVSAMMHGYIATDSAGDLLVPFRTWRNSSTGPAAAALSDALGFTVPLRWSIAHLYQAVLDDEPHVAQIASLTTLAGYVHRALTGENVLGVGDASGMFPIDSASRTYDAPKIEAAQRLIAAHATTVDVRPLLPRVLVAGDDAGRLTDTGAALLDPSGALRPGIPFCPPEGDAGTGMVATDSTAPRTGNVSVGTSIFAMVVLDEPLKNLHDELDIVTTPAGDTVAMVHCNNGASEIAAWARVFGRYGEASGSPRSADDVYSTLFAEALASDPDAGGLLSYNYLAGEPITEVTDGRPLFVRTPDSRFTLGNLVRAEVFSAFATLSIGMEVLAGEGVRVDRLLAHGGLFRTPGAAQQLLSAALDTPIAVETTASEGGAWGIAVLAAFRATAGTDATPPKSLVDFLADDVFGRSAAVVVDPDQTDSDGFASYLARYRAALPLQRSAAAATPAATTKASVLA